jgi:gas vesicle protein
MLILDYLLLAMIAVCIVYCWTLNKRIQDLQNSRIEFARMIKELNVSIVKAETSVEELNTLSKVTTTELKNSIEEARNTTNELQMVNDISNNLADQLTQQVSTIKKDQKNNLSSSSSNEQYDNSRFEEGDFAPIEDESLKSSAAFYANQLKSLLAGVINRKAQDDGVSMNQTSYYDSLRKISVKK